MFENLGIYWSPPLLQVSAIIILHLIGSFGLGTVMGFERVYHGRAAGMRTYALVCTASCGLTIACGFPDLWYGGQAQISPNVDPTRVIQGVMTGIGFLGAGVIMREGQTIRGLSTAASIWMAAAIGTLVGLGFYLSSIAAAIMTTFAMATFRQLEARLPHFSLLKVVVKCAGSGEKARMELDLLAGNLGFKVTDWAISCNNELGQASYEMTVQSDRSDAQHTLVQALQNTPSVQELTVTPMRD